MCLAQGRVCAYDDAFEILVGECSSASCDPDANQIERIDDGLP